MQTIESDSKVFVLFFFVFYKALCGSEKQAPPGIFLAWEFWGLAANFAKKLANSNMPLILVCLASNWPNLGQKGNKGCAVGCQVSSLVRRKGGVGLCGSRPPPQLVFGTAEYA